MREAGGRVAVGRRSGAALEDSHVADAVIERSEVGEILLQAAVGYDRGIGIEKKADAGRAPALCPTSQGSLAPTMAASTIWPCRKRPTWSSSMKKRISSGSRSAA
jgi:hypothetical protein